MPSSNTLVVRLILQANHKCDNPTHPRQDETNRYPPICGAKHLS